MRKWIYLSGSALLGIFALIVLTLLTRCNVISNDLPQTLTGCPSYMPVSFLLFVAASLSLLLIFLLLHKESKEKR